MSGVWNQCGESISTLDTMSSNLLGSMTFPHNVFDHRLRFSKPEINVSNRKIRGARPDLNLRP